MPISAPLRTTVEIALQSGPAAGERRFRLTDSLELPPALHFSITLPLEGEGQGRVRFRLPTGQLFEAAAVLANDPERQERGSAAQLLSLTPDQVQAIQRYIEQRMVEK